MNFNYATSFVKNFNINPERWVDDLIARIPSKNLEQNHNIMQASIWTSNNVYLQNIFLEILSKFTKNNKNLIKSYLGGNSTLIEVIQNLIKFIYQKNITISPVKLKESLKYGDDASNNILFNQIKIIFNNINKYQNLKDKTEEMLEINLLGYGAGNCFYEKQVAQFLNEKFFIRVNIFAYEPYIDPIIKQNLNDITFIDHDNLLSNPNLKFDIILARWVLHHVEEKARWKPLSVFLNACKRRSLIIFHEEGDCFELKNSLPSLLYRFFLSCIDVIINYGLRPEWFLSSTPDIGKNFYIDYLDENDILNIEKLFKFKYRRTIHPISHNNSYGQYLINYEVINN